MPYFIAVYDVESKRGAKVLKLMRQYMTWIQNSVFEGELTEAQYKTLLGRAEKLIQPETDMVMFYRLRDERYVERAVIGKEKSNTSRII